MFPELNNALAGLIEESRFNDLLEVCKALEGHQAVLWKDRVLELITLCNDMDRDAFADKVIDTVYLQVEALFQQMQIDIDVRGMRLSMLARVIECLRLEPSDLDAEMAEALQNSDDSAEALADMFEIYTGEDSVSFIEYIHGVSKDALYTAISVLQSRAQDNSDIADAQRVIRLLSKHRRLADDQKESLESAVEGIPVGTPMDHLINLHSDSLSTMDHKAVAEHLIHYCILSGVPDEALLDEVMHFAEGMFHPVEVQAIYRAASKRVAELFEEAP